MEVSVGTRIDGVVVQSQCVDEREHTMGAGSVATVGGERRESRLRRQVFVGSAVALIVVYAALEGRVVVSLPIVLVIAGLALWRGQRGPVRLEVADGVVELSRRPGRAPERLALGEIEEVGAGVTPGGRVVWVRRPGGEREVLLNGLDEAEAGLVVRMLRGRPQPQAHQVERVRQTAMASVAWAVIAGATAGAALLVVTEWAYQGFANAMTGAERRARPTECAAPHVDVRAPAAGWEDRASDKARYAAEVIATDRLMVHFDPRMAGVVVPREVNAFRESAVGNIEVGHDLPRPIPDLRVDEHGVRATLSFGELGLRPVDIPWAAVFALAPSSRGEGMVFLSDVPPECVDAYVR